MEMLIEKFGWKKVAIVSIIGSLGVIVFAFSSIANVGQKAARIEEENEKRIAANNGESGSGQEQLPGEQSMGQPLKVYLSEHVQVSYPPGYEPSEITPGKDNLSNLRLKNAEYNLEISINAYSYRVKTLEELSKPYELFSKSERIVNSNTVTDYYDENRSLNYIQRVSFIEKDDNIVKVSMIYQGNINEIFESDYASIVDSIK